MESFISSLTDIAASKSPSVNSYSILDALQDLKDRAVSTNTVKHLLDQLVAAHRLFRDYAAPAHQMDDAVMMIGRLILECEEMI